MFRVVLLVGGGRGVLPVRAVDMKRRGGLFSSLLFAAIRQKSALRCTKLPQSDSERAHAAVWKLCVTVTQ